MRSVSDSSLRSGERESVWERERDHTLCAIWVWQNANAKTYESIIKVVKLSANDAQSSLALASKPLSMYFENDDMSHVACATVTRLGTRGSSVKWFGGLRDQ